MAAVVFIYHVLATRTFVNTGTIVSSQSAARARQSVDNGQAPHPPCGAFYLLSSIWTGVVTMPVGHLSLDLPPALLLLFAPLDFDFAPLD